MQLNKKKTQKKQSYYGDTIVEAVIAIAVYSIVAVLALGAMNSGLKSAQKNLESSMARAAVDSQVDSIRFVYENYLIAQNSSDKDADFYKKIWGYLTQPATGAGMLHTINSSADISNVVSSPDKTDGGCQGLISNEGDDSTTAKGKVFALNARALYSKKVIGTDLANNGFKAVPEGDLLREAVLLQNNGGTQQIKTASLYPRIIYEPKNSSSGDTLNSILIGGNVAKGNDERSPSRIASQAEGVWVVLVENKRQGEGFASTYDFYVRTCWNAAGEKSPTTYTTVVRLWKAD